MAGRFNTKFIIILASVVIVIAGGGLGLYALAAYRSVEDRMAEADQHMADGRYEAASEEYGKIIHKTNDVIAIKKFYDAKSMIRVSYGPPAHQAFQHLLGALSAAVREAPADPEIFQRYVDLFMKLGLELGQMGAWTQMYERANLTLEADPDLLMAKKYRGLAQVNRMRGGLNVTDEERQMARDDLEAYLAIHPDDSESLFHLAGAYMVEAKVLSVRPNAMELDIRKMRARGLAVTERPWRQYPDDPQRAFDHVRILLMAEEHDKAAPIINEIAKKMLDEPGSRRDIITLIDLLGLDSQREKFEDLPRVEQNARVRENRAALYQRRHEIFRRAVEAHPNDLVLKLQHGRNLAQMNDPEEAMKVYAEIREVDVVTHALEAFVQTNAKQMATIGECDLMINAAEKTNDPELLAVKLSEIEKQLKEMKSFFGESNAHYYLMLGKFHTIKRDWVDAAQQLRRANDLFDNENAEVLLRLAQALEQIKQGGASMEALSQLLEIDGLEDYLPAKVHLASLNIKHKQFAQAETLIDEIKALDETHPALKQLDFRMKHARGDVDGVIEMLKETQAKNPKLPLMIAQLMLDSDRKEQAKPLLLKEFDKAPGDPTVVALLLRATDDNAEGLAVLKKAKDAGLEADWVDTTERQLSGTVKPKEIVEERIEKNIADPFHKHLARHRLYLQTGDEAKAKEEFRKAKSLDPEHPLIVEIGFTSALTEGRWTDAQDLASQAAASDLDRGGGLFYFGRLELAQKQFERAATTLREGLTRRPDFSLGWQLLGEAQQGSLNFVGAGESFRRALDLVPDSITALRGLASVHAAREEHPEALDTLRRAHEYAPKNRQIRSAYFGYVQQYGSKEKSLALRNKLLETDPDDGENRRHLALLLSKLDRHQEARKALDDLIAREGVTRSNIAASAQLTADAGDEDAADKELETYVKKLGDQAAVEDWLVLARFRLMRDRQDASIIAYKKAIEVEDPTLRRATRELANKLVSLQRSSEAVEIYEQIYKLNPHDRATAYRYIEMVMPSNSAKAKELLEQLVEQQGPDDTSYLLTAMLAGIGGDGTQALEALGKAVQISPDRAIIHIQRSQVLAQLGRIGEAQSSVNRALQLAPSNIQARLLLTRLLSGTGENQQAISELLALLKRDNELSDARLQLANLYMSTDELVQARRLLDESMEMFPEDWRWPYALAKLDRHEGRPTRAAQRLGKAFELKPDANLLNELVIAQIQAKRPEEALQTLRDNPEWIEEFPLLDSTRGWALGELDRIPEASQAFKRAIEVCQNINQLKMVSGHMEQAMGPSKAIEVLEQSRTKGNDILVTFVLAQFDMDDHNFQSVAERLQQIEGDVPMDSPLRVKLDDMLSIALHQVGDYDGAKAAYERLIASNPRDVQSLNNLAYLLSENMGQTEDAKKYIKNANEILPNNAQILDTLGWIQFLTGQKTEAINTLRQSVEIAKMPANCLHMAHALHEQGLVGADQEALDFVKRSKRLAERYQDRDVLKGATELLEILDNGGANP